MISLYPLHFEPVLRRHLWGGRRLATSLGRQLPAGDDYAESWEVCDRADAQTRVSAGPLAGTPLGDLVRDHAAALLGRHASQPRFPLLIKLIDAHRDLSVQVHPNDTQAARLASPDVGKTEAWIVLDAAPGSVVYAGLKRGFDRHALERELNRGTCELCLHRFEPRIGDCIFVPAGTVHALGAGLLIAEIQQPSDVTFRLFDWNRVGPDGKPRALHVRQGLDVIDFERGPVDAVRPQPTNDLRIERLVSCDKFVIERWHLTSPLTTPADATCRVLLIVDGEARIAGDPTGPARRGTTVLLPAQLGAVEIVPQPQATMICAYLP